MGLALEARYRVDSGNADGVKHSQTATSGKAFGSSNAWGAFFIEEAQVSSHPDAEVNYIERAKTFARGSDCVATFRNLGPEDNRIQLRVRE